MQVASRSSAGTARETPAFPEAFLVRAPMLRHYICTRIPEALQSRIDADDVLQDVWIAAFQRISSFREDGPDSLDRWLMGIAKRRLADVFRKCGTVKRGGGRIEQKNVAAFKTSCVSLFSLLASSTLTPSREVSAQEAADAVMIALGSISESRREVLRMRFLEGWSPQEIAKELGKPDSSVNSLLYHAIRDLRHRIGDVGRYLSGDRMRPTAPRSRPEGSNGIEAFVQGIRSA